MEKLQVWWNTDGIERRFDVANVHDAMVTISALTRREVKDYSIGFNAGGLEYFDEESQEWNEWYNDDGLDIKELLEQTKEVL